MASHAYRSRTTRRTCTSTCFSAPEILISRRFTVDAAENACTQAGPIAAPMSPSSLPFNRHVRTGRPAAAAALARRYQRGLGTCIQRNAEGVFQPHGSTAVTRPRASTTRSSSDDRWGRRDGTWDGATTAFVQQIEVGTGSKLPNVTPTATRGSVKASSIYGIVLAPSGVRRSPDTATIRTSLLYVSSCATTMGVQR